MNHYETLGVDKTATQAEIKKAYRKLSMQYHPDKGGDEERFKQVAQAYGVIGDEHKRRQYDQQQANPFANFNNMDGMDGNFSDLFNQFFSGARHQPVKGADVRVEMHISFEEAFTGCSKQFNINGRAVNVNLKPGVRSGQKLRLRGYGQPHPFNSELPAGDCIITVGVMHNAEWIVDNQDNIWQDVNMPWYDIMLGKKVSINTIEGPINITIPENTQPGSTLRIKEKGWPNYDTGLRGALLCKIIPTYPELNSTQLEYIKKVRNNYEQL